MTEQPQPKRPAGHRRRPLYRAVLAIAVAALVAAWLPFSILYINALTKHAVAVATAGSGSRTVSVAAGPGSQSVQPVVTRTS